MKAASSRLALRVGALGLKFVLTIVVARTLGFDAVAVYGVALAVSVVASKVLGLGFSTEINRRLAGPDPRDAIRTCMRLSVLYAGVYVALCGAAALPVGAFIGLPRAGALADVPLVLVMLVACAEHAALEVNTWLFSLHRVRAASWVLFARTRCSENSHVLTSSAACSAHATSITRTSGTSASAPARGSPMNAPTGSAAAPHSAT
ncbi:hypothetical protein [Burkholderia cenocepacia]|uniref:hypothetical protein n=1 Tax=Burkholderia cenocepacia TaxID=95486 RepID=UPI002117F57A|nr:hypothetical protein [Burkholderia cenocepacia]